MTAQEWREKADAVAEADLVDLPLPSGMVIRARRPGPSRSERWRRLPTLIGQASQEAAVSLSNDDILEMIGLMREMVSWCCAEPRIAVDGAAGTMHARDVPDRDLLALVRWALGTPLAEGLWAFRPERPDSPGDGGGGDVCAPGPLSAETARQSDGR